MAGLSNVSGRRRSWGAALLVLAAVASDCGKSPTAPTPVAASSTPASVNAGIITLTGQVTEGPPTTLTQIAGAVVSVPDGANAGKSTTTDNSGFYTLAGLIPGRVNITVAADGYVSTSAVLTLTADTTSNFQLMPAPKSVTETLQGDIAATDGTCSDGTAEYACRIVVFAIHNSGPADATLTWTGTAANLAMTLFQTDGAAPMARSTSSGPNQVHMTATLPGGADYEFRITFASGSGSTTYTLRVTHMN